MPCLNVGKASINVIDLIRMAWVEACLKARKSNDISGDVEASNLDGPLKRTNERLVGLIAIIAKHFRGVQFGGIPFCKNLQERRMRILGGGGKEMVAVIHCFQFSMYL